MGNKESKSRTVRVILVVILILGLLVIGGLLAFFGAKDPMGLVASIYGSLANHLWSSIALPSGVFYLLVVGTIVAALLAGRGLYKKFFSKEEVWRDYRLDTFFWVEWQWDYAWNGKINNLWCECEKCAERLKPKFVPDDTGGLGVRFICNRCGKQSTTIRSVESEAEALDRVEKKILRNIRVGKCRGVIEGRRQEERFEK